MSHRWRQATWIRTLGVEYYIGIDGISLLLVLLTTLLGAIAVGSSWEAIQDRVKEDYVVMLMLAPTLGLLRDYALSIFAKLQTFGLS